MPAVKFANNLVPLVRSEEKIATWRLYNSIHRDFTPGAPIVCCDQTGRVFAHAVVERVIYATLGNITADEAQGHEKYPTIAARIDQFRRYNGPDVDENTPVTIIKWSKLVGLVVEGP